MGKSCCEASVVLPKAPLYNLFDNGAAIYLSFEKSWFLVWRKEMISAWLDCIASASRRSVSCCSWSSVSRKRI